MVPDPASPRALVHPAGSVPVTRSGQRWLVLALSALLAFANAPGLRAQETTGTLSGTLLTPDGQAAFPATLTVSGATGDRQVATDEQGRFVVALLPPGSYRVTARADALGTLVDDDVRVALGQRTVKQFTLLPVLEESVSVSAPRAPAIDLWSQVSGANIRSGDAERIPVGRNVQELVLLAPGVRDGGGLGTTNPSMSGSSGLENQYVFDGLNTTNGGYGALGAYSIVHGSLGQGINFNFVEETQVLTGGLSAEHAASTGGIVNVLTKSGTNEWTGSVFAHFTPTGTQGSFRTLELVNAPGAPTLGVERLDHGFDIGGPLVRDRVFIWLGANPTRTSTTRQAPDDSYGLFAKGPYTKDVESLNYGAKFSLVPAPGHRIDLSHFGDPTHTNFTHVRGSSALAQDTTARFSTLDFGSRNTVLNYQGVVSPTLLVTASLGRARNTLEEGFPDVNDQWNFIDVTGPVVESGGLDQYEQRLRSTNDQGRFKFTHFLGNHELSWGAGRESTTFEVTTQRAGPTHQTTVDLDGDTVGDFTTTGVNVERRTDPSLNGDPGVIETSGGDAVIYRIRRGELSDPSKRTHGEQTHAFVQDRWAVTQRLVLDLGLRWEQQALAGREASWQVPAEISPRVGLSWDPTGKGRGRLRAHASVLNERIPLDMAARLFTPDITVAQDDYFDAALLQRVSGRDPFVLSTGTTRVEAGTRTSRVDEYILGYEHALPRMWTVSGEVQHRVLRRAVEDTHAGRFYTDRDFDGVDDQECLDYLAAHPGAGDALYGLSDIQLSFNGAAYGGCVNFGEFVISNVPPATAALLRSGLSFARPQREYDALVLQATRGGDDRWGVTVQYTLSRLRGNYEGLYRNDNGQSDPNLTTLFDFPNDPVLFSTYSSGALPTDRPHRLQAFGHRAWKNGWSVGSRALVQSGVPRARLAFLPIYGSPGEILLAPRGSLGRTPVEWRLDANVAKRFALGTAERSSLTVELAVFNLMNNRQPTRFDYKADTSLSAAVDAATTEAELAAAIANAVGQENADYGKPTAWSDPRELRLGVTWRF